MILVLRTKFCVCGCGGQFREDSRYPHQFIHGHNRQGTFWTQKRKENFIQLRIGHIVSQITRDRISRANIGRKQTEKEKRNRANTLIGHVVSDATKKKIGEANSKKTRSEEFKRFLSSIHKGKHLSEEHKRKIGKANQGEKSTFWKGGISIFLYPRGWTEALKESIRIRDQHTCQLCGKKQEELSEKRQKKLHIHHIDYDKKNLDPENLISLCRSCHNRTTHNREKWIVLFFLKGLIHVSTS